MNRRMIPLVMALVAVTIILLAVMPAGAAYPGAPGKIVFTRLGAGMFTMNTDGSALTQLPADCNDPVWSPDGTRLACYKWMGGSNADIFVLDADGTNLKQLTDTPDQDVSPTWSPDGMQIAFTSCGPPCHIVVMDVVRGQATVLSQHTDDRAPAWSPDGTKIAFTSIRYGTWELFVMNADGTSPVRLTTNNRSEMSPNWSPDGEKIVFAAVFNNVWEIAVMNANGRGEKQLTHFGSDESVQPAWSPDGKYIVFEHDQDIYRMESSGANQVAITNSPTWDGSPDWQPLRSLLKVSAYIDGRSQLVIHGNELYWHHFDYAAPGRHSDAPGGNVPTYLNDEGWYPVWPGDPPNHNPADPIDNEVRCGDCLTVDQYGGAPPLDAKKQIVALNAVEARGEMRIVQQPAAANDYTFIVEFDDNGPLGAAWYDIILAYDQAPYLPTNDAYVVSSSPNSVFNRKTLNVKDAVADTIAYVKFNVVGLSGTVQKATLRLYTKDPGPDGGRVFATSPFYQGTTTQWLETGLKWKNAPIINGPPVATIGKTVANRWVEVDVTQAVIDGIANQNGRVSFAITNDSTNLVTYSSKEGARPPELVVVTAP